MFRDRRHAGELLAALLGKYHAQPGIVVLALPRGGVPVAAAMSHALALPLDVLLVHKIGTPSEPELAIGAVARDGLVVLDEKAITAMHISRVALESIIDTEQKELSRREVLYSGNRSSIALNGQTVILVDDGLATGYTMLAAVRSVRRQKADGAIIAVPVALQATIAWLGAEADEIVCVNIPRRLESVGQFYEDFSQISDEQVCDELAR